MTTKQHRKILEWLKLAEQVNKLGELEVFYVSGEWYANGNKYPGFYCYSLAMFKEWLKDYRKIRKLHQLTFSVTKTIPFDPVRCTSVKTFVFKYAGRKFLQSYQNIIDNL